MSDESWTSCGNHARPPDSMSAGGVVAIQETGPFKGLDLRNPDDMALLRRAVTRWPRRFGKIDAEARDRAVEVLRAELDSEDARQRMEAAKTLAVLERMNQKDEHWIMDAIMNGGKKSGTQIEVNVGVKMYHKEASTDAV